MSIGMGFRHTWPLAPVFVSALSGCTIGLSDNDIVMVGTDDVKTLVDDAARPGRAWRLALVDPRSPEDFAEGHLPKAMNVEPIQHGLKPPRPIRNASYVIVYGRDPGDALARGMTKRLMENGVNGVRLYAGGLREWAMRGLPIEPAGADPFADDPAPPEPPTLLDKQTQGQP